MEAKRTQLLTDALELTRLVLSSTQANGEQLEKTDASLNNLGQDITALNKVAEDILAQGQEHNDVLLGIKENQQVVYETNASLLETAVGITDVFEKNKDTLVNIEQTLEHGNQQDQQSKDAFISEMSKKNDTYGQHVGALTEEISKTKRALDELNTHDELVQLLDYVSNVTTSVKELESNREKHREEVMNEFNKAETDIRSSIELLETLTTSADDLISTFETAVSRIKTIEFKIDALSEESDELDDEGLDNVAEDTQNQTTEGE